MNRKNTEFSDSLLFKINHKLNSKPWKYIYKELIPKVLYEKIQKEVDFFQQEQVAGAWTNIIKEYFENNLESNLIIQKKNLKNEKIIWQLWGQGWEYEKLPDIVKLCYKSVERYKGNYTVIRLDDENLREYIDFPEVIWKKLKENKMNYTHFSDILRLGLLTLYGGIWLDATILLTDFISVEYEKNGYFMFQRSDNVENKKDWEKFNNSYFSWNKKEKVKVLSSVIFSEKNNTVIRTLFDLMIVFWKEEERIPHYFFFQILYNELTERYLKKYKCKIVSDTLPHELFRNWFETFSDEKLVKITDKINIHKLTHKSVSEKNCKTGTFYDYFRKKFEL